MSQIMDWDSYHGFRKAAPQQGRDVFGYAATGQAFATVDRVGVTLPNALPATIGQLAAWERIWAALPANLPDYDFWWYAQNGNLVHDLRHNGVDGRAEYTPEAVTPAVLAMAGKVAVDLRWGKASEAELRGHARGAQEGACGGEVGQLSEEALGDDMLDALMVEHVCEFKPREIGSKSGVDWCACGMGRAWYETELKCEAPGYSVKVSW